MDAIAVARLPNSEVLDSYISEFAELVASGRMALAIACAAVAEAEALPALESSVKRLAVQHGIEVRWPVPGCPEADEARGWDGWYGGGYGGALA